MYRAYKSELFGEGTERVSGPAGWPARWRMGCWSDRLAGGWAVGLVGSLADGLLVWSARWRMGCWSGRFAGGWAIGLVGSLADGLMV